MDLWRKAVTEDQTREEADFIADVLSVPIGARILDVPCRLGRHTIDLRRRGYQTTGVDLSVGSNTEARRRCGQPGDPMDSGDMAVVNRTCGEEPFDGAFCFGNSFGYADYNTTVGFLRR